jgi:hypothetical protein
MEEIFKGIGVLVGAILATIAPSVVRFIKSKVRRSKQLRFSNNLHIYEDIRLMCREIRVEVEANRIAICEYHNGETSFTGIPFNFVSMLIEDIDLNTKPIIKDFQKIPLGSLADVSHPQVIKRLYECDQEYLYIRRDDPDEALSIIAKYSETSQTLLYKLGKSPLDGILVITWIGGASELTSDQLELVQIKVLHIKELRKKITKYK